VAEFEDFELRGQGDGDSFESFSGVELFEEGLFLWDIEAEVCGEEIGQCGRIFDIFEQDCCFLGDIWA